MNLPSIRQNAFPDVGIGVSVLLISSKSTGSLSNRVIFEDKFGLSSEFCTESVG